MPPKNPGAEDPDLIQHHQGNRHQEHGKERGVRSDDGGHNETQQNGMFPVTSERVG